MGIERLFLADEAATAALGSRLAASLKPGDLVLLEGGLGVGKTTLARAIIRSLCDDPTLDVPSPSFALVQPYDSPRAPLLHADLYRLRDAEGIEELGLFDRPDAIVIVEWPERADLRMPATLRILLGIPPDHRGRSVEIVR
ncbi:MAG: tRNA (adenosine(37)-N6)-threonylcarbamoyltransferase complex ATPase subunit type 1 TsaE [Devosia sp.]